jgi:hypothetical protein
MVDAYRSTFIRFGSRVLPHRNWIVVGLAILFVFSIRMRLRDMPLERDEGEYAYAGQLMLQGVPPYKEAYNMKLPGTYAAYAVIMGIFGQTPAAIHFGLAIINAGSIVLIFLIGSKLLDDVTGVAAAVAFAFMSLSPSVLGLAAHATNFVILPALLGILLLLKYFDSRKNWQLFVSGLLFGIAFLMKQHGVFFGIFGMLYLVCIWFGDRAAASSIAQRRRQTNPSQTPPIQTILYQLGLLGAGIVLPYGLTCAVLWKAGVFSAFVFWTISYASRYVTAIPAEKGLHVLKAVIGTGTGPGLLFWILPALALVLMWWEVRLKVQHRIFLVLLLICSIFAASIGFYFREHYFVLLLPALSLLIGTAMSRAVYLLKHDKSIELFLAIPIAFVYMIALGAVLLEDGAMYFSMNPEQAVRYTYSTTLFNEAKTVGDMIRSQTDPKDRIAVIGSEPEIYFYARRQSATAYIYTYPLVETHAFASKMQLEMIHQIEESRPHYIVYVNDDYSWRAYPGSDPRIFEWWKQFWSDKMDLVWSQAVRGAEPRPNQEMNESASDSNSLLLFKRRDQGSRRSEAR